MTGARVLEASGRPMLVIGRSFQVTIEVREEAELGRNNRRQDNENINRQCDWSTKEIRKIGQKFMFKYLTKSGLGFYWYMWHIHRDADKRERPPWIIRTLIMMLDI